MWKNYSVYIWLFLDEYFSNVTLKSSDDPTQSLYFLHFIFRSLLFTNRYLRTNSFWQTSHWCFSFFLWINSICSSNLLFRDVAKLQCLHLIIFDDCCSNVTLNLQMIPHNHCISCISFWGVSCSPIVFIFSSFSNLNTFYFTASKSFSSPFNSSFSPGNIFFLLLASLYLSFWWVRFKSIVRWKIWTKLQVATNSPRVAPSYFSRLPAN